MPNSLNPDEVRFLAEVLRADEERFARRVEVEVARVGAGQAGRTLKRCAQSMHAELQELRSEVRRGGREMDRLARKIARVQKARAHVSKKYGEK